MKKILVLFILGIISFKGNVVIGQQNVNIKVVNLYNSVLPLIERSIYRFEITDDLEGEVNNNTIKIFFGYKEYNNWIKVYKSSDTMFLYNYYNTFGNPIVVLKSSNDKNIIKCLTVLVVILPIIVGYDSTIKIMESFFEENPSKFYFTELKKAENKMAKMMFTGKPNAGFFRGRHGSYGENWYWSFNGTGNWYIDYVFGKGRIIIGAPFSYNGNMESTAYISCSYYYDNLSINYTCGLYGCKKTTYSIEGKIQKVEEISLKEFLSKYNSVF